MSKEVLFTLYELPMTTNTLYEVVRKKDTQAPQEFINEGTSKVLSNDVTDFYNCAAYDIEKDIWDTGLTETSRALKKAIPNESQRKAVLKSLKKHILDPIEKEFGEGYLSSRKENNFWDKFNDKVYLTRVYNTEEPLQLLSLYQQVLHKRLTPKVNESHPEFKNTSQFCIENKEQKVDRKTAKKKKTTKANALFYSLATEKNNKQALEAVFQWLNLGSTKALDEDTLFMQFDFFLEDDPTQQNTEAFIRTVEDYMGKEDRAEVMDIHLQLKALEKVGKIKKRRSEYWLTLKNGKSQEFLGNSLKNAAEKVANEEELQKEVALLVKD